MWKSRCQQQTEQSLWRLVLLRNMKKSGNYDKYIIKRKIEDIFAKILPEVIIISDMKECGEDTKYPEQNISAKRIKLSEEQEPSSSKQGKGRYICFSFVNK